jgi:hypothetical protein
MRDLERNTGMGAGMVRTAIIALMVDRVIHRVDGSQPAAYEAVEGDNSEDRP